MKKAKIKIVIEVDTALNPEWYPAGSTPRQMLAIALEGANEDPYAFMDNPNAKWEITGELSGDEE